MTNRWKISFFVLFLWYAVFAFCSWTNTGSGFPTTGYTRWLSYLMGLLRLPLALQQWIGEIYAANLILCPPTLVCLAFLAWRKHLPPGHLAKISLFLTWQIALTLILLIAFMTETIPQMLGQVVQWAFQFPSTGYFWIKVMINVGLIVFVCTLPIHCIALWYCLFRKPKEMTVANKLEGKLPT